MTGKISGGFAWHVVTQNHRKVWFEVDAEYFGNQIEFYGRYGGEGFARSSLIEFAICDDMTDKEVEIQRLQYEDFLRNVVLPSVCGEKGGEN